MTCYFRLAPFAWFAAVWLECCLGQAVTATPLVVTPSGHWDGADGPWSTFDLSVGNPVQSFRCVPGLTSPVVIVPLESRWCNDTCAFFYDNLSNTWEFVSDPMPLGITKYIHGFSDVGEDDLSYAKWGLDDVYLGKSARDRNISSQYVVETNQKRFQLGTLGLFPGSVGPPGATRSSLLSALWDTKAIPSLSFGYTAGSASRNTSASLVLGGHDSSRFDPATTTTWGIAMEPNTYLLITLQAIIIPGFTPWKSTLSNSSLSPNAFAIDSAVPQIWLPEEACLLFEAAFGLTWDDTLALYTINETTHARLVRESPEVRFTIAYDEQATNYTLPYSAFDLRLTFPFVDTSTYYFPLKRASDPSQYMLGRTFLQETYITVDYERSRFNLSQASSDSGPANIIPISSPSRATQTPDSPSLPPGNRSSSLSSAAYAGIGIGAGVAVLMALCLLVAWKKHWGPFRRRKNPNRDDSVDYHKAELHNEHRTGVEAMEKERFELDAASGRYEAMDRERAELQTVETARELKGGSQVGVAEVHGSGLVHELPGHDCGVRTADGNVRTA